MQGFLCRKALGLPMPPYQAAALDAFFAPATGQALTSYAQQHPEPKGVYGKTLNDLYHRIGPGCLGVRRRCDVPKNACYVGHHCNTYVWVTREGMENFTNLTIAVLDVSTADTGAIAGVPRPKYAIAPGIIAPPPP